jgi:hypothetical protein
LKTVFEASTAVEAHMILHLLQQAGVESQVLGEFLPGAMGEIPAQRLVRVVVADKDEAEARSVIADWERTQPPVVTPALPKVSHRTTGIAFAVGALSGALMVWWALRTPVWSDPVDFDNDGVVDMQTKVARDMPVETQYDRNSDGKPDAYVGYDRHGDADTVLHDDDFNGKFESSFIFHKDHPVSLKSDRNGNGAAEVRCNYQLGVLADCEYLDEATGKPIKRETYTTGFLSSVELDTDGDGVFERKRLLDWMGEIASDK